MYKHVLNQGLENNGMERALEALGKGIARWTDKADSTAIPGLSLFRRDEPAHPTSGMYEPGICLVAQGAKRVLPFGL
ncbi:MAG: AraC family transcriptional regulator [Nitrospiraceae bacterium]|nr:AraC family transcriptional regulator [Nitrospiraceae bacterium]